MILFSLLGNNTKQANNTSEIYNNVLFFITIIGITELVISLAFEKECFNCVDKSYIHTQLTRILINEQNRTNFLCWFCLLKM
jgi:hypothetical protein